MSHQVKEVFVIRFILKDGSVEINTVEVQADVVPGDFISAVEVRWHSTASPGWEAFHRALMDLCGCPGTIPLRLFCPRRKVTLSQFREEVPVLFEEIFAPVTPAAE